MVKKSKKAPVRPVGKRIEEAEIKLIRKFHEDGKSNKWIAKTLKISKQAVSKWINRRADDLKQRFSTGRPATLNTPVTQRVLIETQRENHFNTFTVAQFRVKTIEKRRKGSKVHTALTTMSESTFSRTMDSAELERATRPSTSPSAWCSTATSA